MQTLVSFRRSGALRLHAQSEFNTTCRLRPPSYQRTLLSSLKYALLTLKCNLKVRHASIPGLARLYTASAPPSQLAFADDRHVLDSEVPFKNIGNNLRSIDSENGFEHSRYMMIASPEL
jgi:hypothetical protein